MLRKWRSENPVRYAYQTTKDNAKRRGKPFELTLQQFEKLCYKTQYLAGKGRSKESLSLDCIENDKGYIYSNIRVITLGENSSKGIKMLEYDWRTRAAKVISR